MAVELRTDVARVNQPARASTRGTLSAVLAALPRDVDRARRAIASFAEPAGDTDWGSLIVSATDDGVLGVLAPLLADVDLPAPARADLRRRSAVEALWHTQVIAELSHAVHTLARAGVTACALKGPVLAARVYGDPAARPSVDIDLLIHPADLQAATAALEQEGYDGDSGVARTYQLRHSHHLHFVRPGRPQVELHFLAHAGFGASIPASALLDRASVVTLDPDVPVLVPSPEDEVLYLTVHAAGHSFARLRWLHDLKLLILRHPALDWAVVAERAQRLGMMTAVAYAVCLLQRWLGIELGTLPRAFESARLRTALADRLLDDVSRPQTRSPLENLGGLFFTSLLCDRVTSTGWMLQHHLSRAGKHKLKQLAPLYLPEAWSA